MNGIIVVKFGGSVLQNGASMLKAASMVKRALDRGQGVAVVVSALKGATDLLLRQVKDLNPDTPPPQLDEVLAMGERTSARLFASALMTMGIEPMVVDLDSPLWPIVTDCSHLDANPLFEETRANVQRDLKPLIESGKVPVVCGFIGRSTEGKVTTLGRGGSDTTAVLLGSCLDAKEIILVKDVDTVFTSDPDKVEGALPVPELTAEEALALSLGGAKFLHHKALRYKAEGVRLRIASIEDGGESGTVINGAAEGLRVESSGFEVSMVTIVGVGGAQYERLGEMISQVQSSGGRIIALTLESGSVILYVETSQDLLKKIHGYIVSSEFGKAVSIREGFGMLRIKGSGLETTPGLIHRVTQPLARNSINIFGLVTISSSIQVFLARNDVKRATELLKSALVAAQ